MAIIRRRRRRSLPLTRQRKRRRKNSRRRRQQRSISNVKSRRRRSRKRRSFLTGTDNWVKLKPEYEDRVKKLHSWENEVEEVYKFFNDEPVGMFRRNFNLVVKYLKICNLLEGEGNKDFADFCEQGKRIQNLLKSRQNSSLVNFENITSRLSDLHKNLPEREEPKIRSLTHLKKDQAAHEFHKRSIETIKNLVKTYRDIYDTEPKEDAKIIFKWYTDSRDWMGQEKARELIEKIKAKDLGKQISELRDEDLLRRLEALKN